MELVINIITGYLKHNNRIVVPQLGTFIVKPSDGSIIFSELMRTDDGVLRSLLVAYGINELAANGMIDRLRFEIKHAVAEGQKYTIANFGEFSSGENGTIRFRQRREPQVFGGKIKPPIERLEEERLKLQRIQRIRQQQSENITGHSTHRKLRTSQTITTPAHHHEEDDDLALGKPDRYLKGLKYENRKGRNQEEESYGSSNRGGGGKVVLIAIILIAIGLGIWFTWQWTQSSNTAIVPEVEATVIEEIVEPTDSLVTSDEEQVVEQSTTALLTPLATPLSPAPTLPLATPTTTQSISNTTL